ncbi:hypothetical protein K3495_g490 [Podosphaera aphanis]|nr:hypothetical protein K3495_g490 [Podosphaera aphanis]
MPKLLSLFALMTSVALSIATPLTPTTNVLTKRAVRAIDVNRDTANCYGTIYDGNDFALTAQAFIDIINQKYEGYEAEDFKMNIDRNYYSVKGPYYRLPIIKGGKYPAYTHATSHYAIVSSSNMVVVAVEIDTEFGIVPCST